MKVDFHSTSAFERGKAEKVHSMPPPRSTDKRSENWQFPEQLGGFCFGRECSVRKQLIGPMEVPMISLGDQVAANMLRRDLVLLHMPSGIGSERLQHPPASRIMERRRRTRENVRLPVLVFSNDHVAECMTDNLSSEGLFFRSEVPIDSGALLTCFLKIPRYGVAGSGDALTVVCQVQVLRSERLSGSNGFGIAGRIEEYHCEDTRERVFRAGNGSR